jgi:hypothetical protein
LWYDTQPDPEEELPRSAPRELPMLVCLNWVSQVDDTRFRRINAAGPYTLLPCFVTTYGIICILFLYEKLFCNLPMEREKANIISLAPAIFDNVIF